jgi:hypothetical protein
MLTFFITFGIKRNWCKEIALIRVSIFPLSTICLLDLGNVLTVWNFLFHF